ncbi:MAG: bifunctional diaminohydroxyphosphoribosylaminopyrimidine deaminase/5-amino-6-(5-phosphoribosylamino)uracil reductase RibD [Candidatus Omnitrophica bacterium]|nr:bifunctional diaminohydroxyphosphoribosylaminopyrimidine deaminase/5-amino-6-(5-phosphoribosylamino)uracil reductase RibD [Candidatus Omnitrophota bacterium]
MLRDEYFMKMAIGLAARGGDRTYPNPMVGAVIVRGGKVIGAGYHRKAGEDHAEIRALKNAKGPVRGASMYVSLEPCAHYGKTPPCVDTIISSGIKKVYYAMVDPNPITRGKGTMALKDAGIFVVPGICSPEALDLNRKYIKFITLKMPYVTVKLAETLDGKIAASDGSSKWITSELSRDHARRLRRKFSAVLIGANTALNDDPSLLAPGKDTGYTMRVVVDTKLRLPETSRLIKTSREAPLLVATTELGDKKKAARLERMPGVEIMVFKSVKGGVPLAKLLSRLAGKGLVSVMVEGGGEIVGSLLAEKLVDEWIFFISPKILGGAMSSIKGPGVKNIRDAVTLSDVKRYFIGEDMVIRGRTCSRG